MRRSLRSFGRCLALLAVAGVVLPTGATVARADALDWCAPVVIRPDQRWWSASPCEPWWKPDTIATRADFVFDGFAVPATPVLPPDTLSCFGPASHASLAAYHADLRARAALQGRTLGIIWYHRFDLVDRQMAAVPGFDADFLVTTATPWSQSMEFFERDTTESCVCGCAWSLERGPSGTIPPGTKLADLIDATDAPFAHRTKVHYAIRPSTGGAYDGAPRRFFGSSAVVDQRNPAYRAWAVAQAAAGIAAGGFDAVELNHKLSQYHRSTPAYVWGGPLAPDVERYMTLNDTLWSGQPAGYGYPEYVEGFALLAQDLTAASVPYTVTLPARLWRASDQAYYDDPATPLVDEAASIRSAAHTARWVFVDRIGGGTAADVAAATADVAAHGTASVVAIDSGCGFGPVDQPQAPLPALQSSLAVVPDAGAVLQYQGRSITVRPAGTSSGAWDVELFCHCASAPCGVPDATATGITSTSWTAPAGVCDARWNGGTGSWRPRARITRAGATAESTDTVTICAPACSNGKDDDGDGHVDFPSDPGCGAATDRYESPQCDNGRDDDGDGLVDFPADPGCVLPSLSFETPPASCGLLGIEAALVSLFGTRLRAARSGSRRAAGTLASDSRARQSSPFFSVR